MTDEPKSKRVMPKGGRKGGAIFPRIPLKDAVAFARKLVSKTHVSAQPRDVILSGVVGAKGTRGNIRISALKQFGFLKGDSKSNYSANELAKRVDSAPPEELVELYRISALKPTIFNAIFDTFQGDVVTRAKLKQRAADLKVHPDETENCVEVYISSLTTAELVKANADGVTHVSSSQLATGFAAPKLLDQAEEVEIGDVTTDANDLPDIDDEGDADTRSQEEATNLQYPPRRSNGIQPAINVSINIDSSMDVDKLQKQLELLKRFGAI